MSRALAIALGKVFFGKILKISLPRAREEALGKKNSKKNHFFAEGGPSAKKPPTAPARDGFFSLPRAVLALGKGFAECPIGSLPRAL